MTYSFNDICRMITGTDADDVCAPEKKSDWLSVAKYIMAGFSTITKPEWVNIRPIDILHICDSTFGDDTFDKFAEKYADTSLETLYTFVTEESASEYLLDDEEDRNALMNRAYDYFAKAIARAYICQNAERDGRKPVSRFLEEKRLETFKQFLFRKGAFDDFVQIED